MSDRMPPADAYEYDDDDIPWADPQIRINYEAALGRLILAHNEMDRHLTLLIEKCLEKLGHPPEHDRFRFGRFTARLNNLRTLNNMSAGLPIAHVDFDGLEAVNGQRNIVAHGHFEQNPFMGDYILITNKETHRDFSVERLNDITVSLEKQTTALKPIIYFAFDEIEFEFPESATSE